MKSVLLVLLLGATALAQEKPLAIVAKRLIPISGPEVAPGVIVFQDGKIIAAGAKDAVTIPDGATVREFDGVIMPGLVDTHSHVGGGSGGDRSAPLHPSVRIRDSIDVRDPGFTKARAGGLTTINVMPGSGHLLSGQTVYLKLRKGRVISDLQIEDKWGRIAGGIKMANGTNPRGDSPFPGTRAKAAAMVRKLYIEAQEYKKKLADGETPPRNLGLEALGEVLDGTRIVHHHTHRHDDIVTVLRLAKEFGFRVVLHHVSEGWKVAEQIAAAGAPCSVIMIDSPGGKLEAIEFSFETGAILEKAGVRVAYHTDDGITDSRLFFRSAALGIRGGLSRKAALESLTLAGAEMLDLQHRIGTLEPGKDADFILLSGDPFSVYTKIQETWIEGTKVFDRSDPKDRLFAVGGEGASHGQHMHIHGEGDAK